MTAAPHAPTPPAAPRWKRWLLGLAWLVLGLLYVMPLTRVLEPDLDSSVHATYAHFTAHGFQFGPEVNTTAGPYGFVMFGWDYSGELFWTRYVLIIAFAYALAALILWFFVAARSGWQRWLWLLAVIGWLGIGDNRFNGAILLCGLYLLLNYQRADRRLPVLLVTAFLAELSLMKGTQLAVAFAVILVIAALAVLRRTWRDALWVVGGFGGALIAWWCAAGQNPLHLPAFIDGIRHIAADYNEAMAIEETPVLFRFGVGLLAALSLLILSTGWRRRSDPVMLAGAAMLAGFTAVAWKHGYVRADGHIYVFLDFGVILALTVLVLEHGTAATPARPVALVGSFVLAGLAVALGLGGAEQLWHGRVGALAANLGPQLAENFRFVFDPSGAKAFRDFELFTQQRAARLPEVREAVGRRTIDFFGHEIGRLLLNELHYAPAPMCCGSYHVYNRHFKELNLRHFSDPRTRPDFVLMKFQSIDWRFAPMDDSLSLLLLLDSYRPALLEDGMILFEARPDAAASPPPRHLATRPVRFGEEVAVPEVTEDEMLLFSVDLPPSVAGRARALVYKPPAVFMDVDGTDLSQTRDIRLIPGSIAVPSLLTPALENTADVVKLLAREPGKKITRFRLHTPKPGCFRESAMSVTFSVVRRPPPMPPVNHYKFHGSSVYDDPPAAVEPASAPIDYYRRLRVQYLHAPASVTFRLRGDERRISFIGGIDQNAYTNGGRTDGVDFFVELQEAGSPRRVLTRRVLQPASVVADRGTHLITGVLPPFIKPGSTLIVRTDPGDHHDAAWDWSFATSFRFTRGDFVPEQFPGFSTLPVTCDGDSVTPMGTGSRVVTMVAAPGGFTLAPADSATKLTFTGGLLEGSYTSGETDGAAFFVDLEFPDGTTRRIFSKLLRPKTVPADRGDQTMTVALPPRPAGTRLHLRTDPGPAGNAAYDWVYVAELHVR